MNLMFLNQKVKNQVEKKESEEEEDFKFDDDLKEFDLFNDSGSFDDDDDDDF